MHAGILCNDPAFRRYAGETSTGHPCNFSIEAAAMYLRTACGITSRAELASNAAAREKFDMLRTEFDAWRGSIRRHR